MPAVTNTPHRGNLYAPQRVEGEALLTIASRWTAASRPARSADGIQRTDTTAPPEDATHRESLLHHGGV